MLDLQHNLKKIASLPLFAGIAEDDAASMLGCLDASMASYGRGSLVYRAGERTGKLGLVISGRIRIESVDYWGNRDIIAMVGEGDMFAESYALSPQIPMLSDAVADGDSTVLFLDAGRLISSCPSACPFHAMAIRRFLAAMGRKNIALVSKMHHLSRRTTREKVLSYLSDEARKAGSDSFSIPLDRQQMADYLAVDRSALSTVLGRMREEGLIDFDRSSFHLIRGR